MPLAPVTDDTMLHDLMWRHTEDQTFSSGLWTLPELANYLTERQNRFNAATGLVLARASLTITAASTVTLPADWSATHRVAWHPTGALAGRTFAVPRGDRFSAYSSSSQVAPLAPLAADDHAGGTRVLELLPAVFPSSGTLDLLYVSTLTALTLTPGNPVAFSVPFDFVPYLVYGVMGDMLSKSGRGQDLERAAYAELRYQEGLAVAALLLEGFA